MSDGTLDQAEIQERKFEGQGRTHYSGKLRPLSGCRHKYQVYGEIKTKIRKIAKRLGSTIVSFLSFAFRLFKKTWELLKNNILKVVIFVICSGITFFIVSLAVSVISRSIPKYYTEHELLELPQDYDFHLNGSIPDSINNVQVVQDISDRAQKHPNAREFDLGDVGILNNGKVYPNYNLFGKVTLSVNIAVADKEFDGTHEMCYTLERRDVQGGKRELVMAVTKRQTLRYNGGAETPYVLFEYDFTPAEEYILAIYIDGYRLGYKGLSPAREG